MLSTLVEAGNAKSMTEEVSMSSSCFRFLVISGSLQIQMAFMGSTASAYHSLRVCPSRAIEGTKNSIKPLPWVCFSAMRSDVNVLPVPQAMMSLPRSLFLKWLWVLLTAAVWCGRSSFLPVRATSPVMPLSSFCQFRGASLRSCKLILDSGGFWFLIASCAFVPHLLVVEIQSLWAKECVFESSSVNCRLEVAKKLSTAGLSM